MSQLLLPVQGLKPEHLRPKPPPPPEPEPEDRYQRCYKELESFLRHLQNTMVYGEGWQKAWKKAQKDICESHGWDVEEFYEECFRRWRCKNNP